MRIGGLASGMDVDQLVDKLMKAERMPLKKMEQDQTNLEWKRDRFRDINKSLLKLDNMTFDMKMSKTYRSKTVSSSQENAVTATSKSGTPDGTYRIEVEQLATPAINVGEELDEEFDLNKTMGEYYAEDENGVPEEIHFTTFEADGKEKNHKIEIDKEDTVNSVLEKINEHSHVRAFYDMQSNKVFLEATRTGSYHPNGGDTKESDDESSGDGGYEIEFGEDSFFSKVLNLKQGNEKGGEDATFSYNGVKMTSKENSYELNDITFQFKDKTNGNATLTVSNDTDAAFDSIMEYIDQYNEVVETFNETQKEEKHRDYQPLTEEQKKEMSDKEIELWEEKAKSGILHGESAISGGLSSMRQSWYANVETDGDIKSLTQLGITTSSNYLDGGKLVVKDEAKLKEALRNDPDSVYKLFSNSGEGEGRGIMNRLDDVIDSTMKNIERQAGSGTDTLENYSLGKQMKGLNQRIDSFKERMTRVENRYWKQFSAMEKSIQQMNQQSDYFMQQFGAAQ